MNTLERFVWGVQTYLLARAARGDLSAAALAGDVVISATFVDPDCIDELEESMPDERLYFAVAEFCAWQTYASMDGQEMEQPAWLRFGADE